MAVTLGYDETLKIIIALVLGGVVMAVIVGVAFDVDVCALWSQVFNFVKSLSGGAVEIPCPQVLGGG